MAEILLSAFLSVVFEKLASSTITKLARANDIHLELKKWERSLSQIRALLNDASLKEITNEAVKLWLNNLQHLAYDIDDILDHLATEAIRQDLENESGAITSKVRKLIPTRCISFSQTSKMHEKLNNITTTLQDLLEENNILGLIEKDERSKHTNRKFQTSLVDASNIVGRQVDKDALLSKLFGDDEPCSKNYNVVPIVGMGGVGKTTIARLLYDEKQVKDHFEVKAWVCVSDDFDIFNISKVIYQSVSGKNNEFTDLNLLQMMYHVWSESWEDWKILEGPFLAGARGSKIIITTRKQILVKKLGYNPYHVEILSYDHSLSLFCQNALGLNNFDSHPSLKLHGEGIVEKCDGLPLALIALGRLLRTKIDEEDWKEILNSEIWRLGKNDEIVPALRLSYHDLPACLKCLFAYCSLFPKDFVFDKEDLIFLWMAEGFLYRLDSCKSTERLGHEYFEELLSRSFFQYAPNKESMFVMHDLMNDLATSVAGDIFLRLEIENEIEGVKKEDLGKCRHMSLVPQNNIIIDKFKKFRKAKSLRTFLVSFVGDKIFSKKILDDLLPELPLLRVLRLSNCNIKEVPNFIGRLKHLRYLNLSHSKITYLPENVSNLYNLQTLIVFGCHELSKLPYSFSKLKQLRHFDFGDTPLLNKIPVGIGRLKNLQTLSKIIIGDNGFTITDFKELKNLHGKIHIKGLDKVENAMHAREANFSQKKFSELKVEWSDVFDGSRKGMLEKEVLSVLKPHTCNLKRLEIVSYGGLEFPDWVGNRSFLRLVHVSISGCKNCTSLPPLGQLLSLKELYIQDIDMVKVVCLEVLGTNVAFPSLEVLRLKNMKRWEVWSTKCDAVGVVFPCLRELYIEDCPNLVEVSLRALDSVRHLKISSCGECVLKSLINVASLVTTLKISSIKGLNDEVWGDVLEYLGAVEKLTISGCHELKYLWRSEIMAAKVLVNLKSLDVLSCKRLVSLGEKEEDDNYKSNLTSLRKLAFIYCDSMERVICPNSTENLHIYGCASVTSISFLTGGGKNFKSLFIYYCPGLSETELGVLLKTSMPMLEFVNIIASPNLKSIIKLGSFIHLTTLIIVDCSSIESFPDHNLPTLTMLKDLQILNCPSMDASFPRGLWPPKLCTLTIGRLKKRMSDWGPQSFPTSLFELTLWSGLEDGVSNCSQLSQIIPPSLTYLCIHDFENLESLSTGLEHLASLRHLAIFNCQSLKYLPEMLLPSLWNLHINGCPYLEKKTSRRGSYWPLISHIPELSEY